MENYPNSVKSFTTHVDNSGEYVLAAHINDIQAEIVALESQLIAGGVNIATATPTASAVPKADAAGKLAVGWIPTTVDADKLDGLHVGTGIDAHVVVADAAGNVGIGVVPLFALHVKRTNVESSIVTQSTGPSDAASFRLLGGSAGADWALLTNRADVFGSADSIGFYKGAGSVGAKLTIHDNGQVYIAGNCNAESFTDRTPFYKGDALAEIKAIKEIDGKIDHATLPAFVRVEREVIVEPAVEAKGKVKAKPAITEIRQERDLGAMISMMTVAIQQLDKKLNDLIIKQEGIK